MNVTFGRIRELPEHALTFDFDFKYSTKKMGALLRLVTDSLARVGFQTECASGYESASGKIHIQILPKNPIEPRLMILLQLAFGSDPYRERQNARRLIFGVREWSYLFDKKLKSEIGEKEWETLNQRAKSASRGVRERTPASKRPRELLKRSDKHGK